MDGVIIVDKPEGWTSHDVVARMRRLANTRRIGHLGTLDPIATGVLPVVIGKATRLAQFYTRSDKIYEGVVRFGWSTDTYDRAGTPVGERIEARPERCAIERILETFRGEIRQAPPPVSAKKVGGKRAYELARNAQPVELEPVPVQIYDLELVRLEGSDAVLRAHCSGGTYMRSLAHDLGQAIGYGAHLHDLRRLASGEFDLQQARTMAQLEALAAESRLPEAMVPAARMLPGFPSIFVDDLTAAHIRYGRNFPASPFRSDSGSRYVKAVTRAGELVAIGEAVLPNLYHPAVVL